jgi:hypothetical protein
MFDLARCNFLEVLGGKMKEWKALNETAKRQNMHRINKLWAMLMKEDVREDWDWSYFFRLLVLNLL